MTSSKLLAAFFAVVSTYSNAATPKLYEAVEPHMGTLFRIKLYATDEVAARKAFRAAFDRIAELDRILSDYNPQSELSLVTQKAVQRPFEVSDELFAIVSASQQISVDTGGAFDLTVGPLTRLWRQGRRDKKLPAPSAIEEALAHIGFQKIHLHPAGRTIEFDMPGMLLDAGGIAKGYAADEALAVLTRLGIKSALVAASGDLAFSDAPPGTQGWTIGIDSFDSADKPFTRILKLANAAVSTSGDEEQHVTIGGRSYSHIIDPKTGLGLGNNLTVTTISRRGILADPAATAICVLGADKGLAYADKQPDLAVFLLDRTNGKKRELESKRFVELVKGLKLSSPGLSRRPT